MTDEHGIAELLRAANPVPHHRDAIRVVRETDPLWHSIQTRLTGPSADGDVAATSATRSMASGGRTMVTTVQERTERAAGDRRRWMSVAAAVLVVVLAVFAVVNYRGEDAVPDVVGDPVGEDPDREDAAVADDQEADPDAAGDTEAVDAAAAARVNEGWLAVLDPRVLVPEELALAIGEEPFSSRPQGFGVGEFSINTSPEGPITPAECMDLSRQEGTLDGYTVNEEDGRRLQVAVLTFWEGAEVAAERFGELRTAAGTCDRARFPGLAADLEEMREIDLAEGAFVLSLVDGAKRTCYAAVLSDDVISTSYLELGDGSGTAAPCEQVARLVAESLT